MRVGNPLRHHRIIVCVPNPLQSLSEEPQDNRIKRTEDLSGSSVDVPTRTTETEPTPDPR